ncbi:MAG: TIGR04002 family protein [Clostridia bacterium]|nr:TIGR04002 family protein [Clostridia bacterium]
MNNQNIKRMSLTGIFTALVFVITAYLHIPTYNGYIHVGDGFIYLAACLLPTPYAMFVGGAGALLADCLTGYAIWAPGSVIMKAVAVLLFTSKGNKIVNLRNTLALVPATLLCAGGYYLYEALAFNGFIAALEGIPGSLTQSVASGILFVVAGLAMDQLRLKQKLYGGT